MALQKAGQKITNKMRKSVVLKIRVTPAEKEQLRSTAVKHSSTMSQLIRLKIAELK